MTTRRTFLGTSLVATVAASGCMGLLTGDTIEVSATDIAIADDAVSEHGYSESRDDSMVLTREVEVAGQTRTIEVTNHVAEYSKSVGVAGVAEQEIARVAVFSTPKVGIAGQTVNPIGEWSRERLVRELASQYEGLSDIEEASERSLAILGAERTVSAFTATDSVGVGVEVEVLVHVTRFAHGGDFVVGLAVHPTAVDEADAVNGMLGATEHGD